MLLLSNTVFDVAFSGNLFVMVAIGGCPLNWVFVEQWFRPSPSQSLLADDQLNQTIEVGESEDESTLDPTPTLPRIVAASSLPSGNDNVSQLSYPGLENCALLPSHYRSILVVV